MVEARLLLKLLLQGGDLVLHPVEEGGEELEGAGVLGDQRLGPPDHQGEDVEPEHPLLVVLGLADGGDGGHRQVALLQLVPVPLPALLEQDLGEGHVDVLELCFDILIHHRHPRKFLEPGFVVILLPLLQFSKDGGFGESLGFIHELFDIVIETLLSRHVELCLRLRHVGDLRLERT